MNPQLNQKQAFFATLVKTSGRNPDHRDYTGEPNFYKELFPNPLIEVVVKEKLNKKFSCV